MNTIKLFLQAKKANSIIGRPIQKGTKRGKANKYRDENSLNGYVSARSPASSCRPSTSVVGGREERLQKMGPTTTTTMASETMPNRGRREQLSKSDLTPGRHLEESRILLLPARCCGSEKEKRRRSEPSFWDQQKFPPLKFEVCYKRNSQYGVFFRLAAMDPRECLPRGAGKRRDSWNKARLDGTTRFVTSSFTQQSVICRFQPGSASQPRSIVVSTLETGHQLC